MKHYMIVLITLLILIIAKTECLFAIEQKIWPENVRGINTKLYFGNTAITEDIVVKLKGWGVNCIRVTIKTDPKPQYNESDILRPYKKHLSTLKELVLWAKTHDMYVISSVSRGLAEEEIEAIWVYIAKEIGEKNSLIGYDLVNEPNPTSFPTPLSHWQEVFMPQLVNTIRQYDTNTHIIIESGPGGKVDGFATLQPVNDPKVIYSFHMYQPNRWTHQKDESDVYPGWLRQREGSPYVWWDRNTIRQRYQAAIDFQNQHNVQILIGEFSVKRWAIGAANYIEDVTSVIDELGWAGCYHSYAASDWNPTHANDAPHTPRTGFNQLDGGAVTDRLLVLLDWWSK